MTKLVGSPLREEHAIDWPFLFLYAKTNNNQESN